MTTNTLPAETDNLEEAENDRFEVAGSLWLITPMLRDAEAGRFGKPVVLPVAYLHSQAFVSGFVYPDKIERFKAQPTVLTRPALISQYDDGSIRIVFDGRHRLTAIQETGQSHFSAWSVPLDLLGNYMLHPDVVADVVAALLATAVSHEETFSDDLETH